MHESTDKTPYIVALGGTLTPDSATEKALRLAAAAAEKLGAKTTVLAGKALDLPLYAPGNSERSAAAQTLIAELRRADGLILASPVYHGSISGAVKNMLDYVEDMRTDALPYFEGRAVGLISIGAGWQGAVSTLHALRGVVHALRGWPTPFGLAINSMETSLDAEGYASSPRLQKQMETLAREVVDFSLRARGGSRRAQTAGADGKQPALDPRSGIRGDDLRPVIDNQDDFVPMRRR